MKCPDSRPKPRPATWGHRSAPSDTARSDSSISSRHRSGAASTCTMAKVTGRWMAADRRRIQSTSSRGADDVLAGGAGRGQLEDAGAELAEGGADAEELVLGGIGAGHGLAVDGPVGDRPRGGEAERPGGDRLLHHLLHGGDVLGRGRLVAGPPLAHHVGAHGAVGDLGADVDGPAAAVEGVEVLGEGLPLPRHALGQGGAGDVLDALHQADQPLVAVGVGRGEPDTAVAGDQRGDTVPAARGEHLVPRGLAVVVGVDVDPPRRDQQTVGVDGAGRGLAAVVADAGDASVADTVTSAVRAGAPVPSTTVPPWMTRSCMGLSPSGACDDAGTGRVRAQWHGPPAAGRSVSGVGWSR